MFDWNVLSASTYWFAMEKYVVVSLCGTYAYIGFCSFVRPTTRSRLKPFMLPFAYARR